MRLIGKLLLLLILLPGLALGGMLGPVYEVVCDTADSCAALFVEDHHGHHHDDHHHPCPGDPPPCPHEPSGGGDQPPGDGGDTCPSPDHHHHHHHHCVSVAPAAWAISSGEPLALHPPLPGETRPSLGFLFVPESPASVLDRPPIA